MCHHAEAAAAAADGAAAVAARRLHGRTVPGLPLRGELTYRTASSAPRGATPYEKSSTGFDLDMSGYG